MPGFLTSLFATLTMFFPGFMTNVMFLTGTESTSGFLDLNLVDSIMDMVVSVVSKFATLFTIWPLNLFLILAIIGFCVGFFFKARKGARR